MTAAQADAAAIELHSALNALFALTASQPTANLWQSIEAVCIGTTAADLGEESESNIRTAVRRLLPSSVQVGYAPKAEIALRVPTSSREPPFGLCTSAGLSLQQCCYRPRVRYRRAAPGLRSRCGHRQQPSLRCRGRQAHCSCVWLGPCVQ
ncbi:hypothetical protein Vretifemale_5847 [Volvox reticuliferus]|nr:hypothetical protein Vretifemale_5847 [Volvox reticuliferus]